MSDRMQHEKNKKVWTTCGICAAVFGIGLFMVENLSKRESPPLGQVFNVIVGFLLIAVAVIVAAITLKQHFFPKKKKKKSKPVFLDESLIHKRKQPAGKR